MQTAYKTYLFSYEHDGASWVLELKATDPVDAQRRISRLQHAKFDGELIAKLTPPSFFHAISNTINRIYAILNQLRQK